MDAGMLTEDIDSALRALERGAVCVHEPNVLSYELAPTTFSSFLKQRLRWAQGWTQASYRHYVLSYKKSPHHKRSPTTRFGLLSLLLIRELSYYLVSQYTCMMLSFIITGFPTTPGKLKNLIFFEFPASEWLFIIGAVCLLGSLAITYFVLSEFVTKRMVIKFTLLYPFYLILGSCIGLYGHFRQIVLYSAWNATVRS
jgi:cellulose synthase/poly-beta-1,6-N-acetylglucosamine synthase-like glycosyltransferase